jgi:tetratricopeptide (TPR) repeat protein
MADANQLKIQARREEAAGDYAQASRLYRRALSAMAEKDDLPDPSLLVRVADLDYRQDDSDGALEYYRRAVEEYAEQGLITNAIAVCNKILRVYPDCVECYRRLADLHLDVGLAAEARQNLMRYADRAWDPDAPSSVLDAMRDFLARTPDQDVALRLASHLADLDREEEGIEVLQEIWEMRTQADADVESLERRAREIQPGLDLSTWAADEDEEEDGAGPARPSADEEVAETDVAAVGNGRDLSGEPGAMEEPDPAEAPSPEPDEAGAGEPSLWGRVVSFGGVETPEAGPGEASPAGTPGAGDGTEEDETRPWEAEEAPVDPAAGAALEPSRRREADEVPASAGSRVREDAAAPTGPRHDERELELVASYRERFTEVAAVGPSNGNTPSAGAAPREQSEEQAMDDRDRGNESVATGTSWWEEDDLGTSGGASPEEGREAPGAPDDDVGVGDAGTGDAGERGGMDARTPPPVGEGDDELGEEAELRRGLELVDEMLEVQPDSLKLRERKVRYARRLGDRDTLVDAFLDLAERLAQEDSRRSARALYREVLELDPENEAAEAGLARLDVGELEDKRQSGKRAGAGHGTPEAATPGEQEARRELGMRLWTEFENSIREMPWLHAATQAYQATGPESLPPLEAFEMLAHYLMARGRDRDAAQILSRSLELAGDEDEKMADVLYYLGVAHEKLGEEGRAEEYFRRLESVDPEFSRVRSAIRDTGDEG